MKLGLMQPYFMPYIGYWQRIKAVDRHIIYDDVNYIKNRWMNHNRILLCEKEHLFNIPLIGASPNKLINEVLSSKYFINSPQFVFFCSETRLINFSSSSSFHFVTLEN